MNSQFLAMRKKFGKSEGINHLQREFAIIMNIIIYMKNMISSHRLGSLLLVLTFFAASLNVLAADITSFSASRAYYHCKSGTIVYTEAIGDDMRLAAIDKKGKKTVLETFSTKLGRDGCAKLGDVGVSPRGWLVFVEVEGCVEGGSTEIYDLRTGKQLKMEKEGFLLFDPNKAVFFSKDVSRMAIRTEGSELMGTLDSIYVQDPKSLKLKSIYSIDLEEYTPIYEK